MRRSALVTIAVALLLWSGGAFAQAPPDAGADAGAASSPDAGPAPGAPPPDAGIPDAPPATPIAVTGRVIDNLGRPMKGVSVSLEGGANVTTDATGRYKLDAPVGATLVVASEKNGVSLATVTGPVLDDVVLLLDLANEKIEIRGEAPTPATGAAQLDREELQRIPGTGGDIVRARTARPGVVHLQIPPG